MLWPDLVAQVQLASHRLEHEVGLPSEHAHAEAVGGVDVFVAVDVPQVRALRAFDHDLVDDLLQQRTEAVDHSRVGHVRPVGLVVFLGFRGTGDVALDECVELFVLDCTQFLLVGRRDPGDRAKGFLDIVFGVGKFGFVIGGRRRRRGHRSHHLRRRRDGCRATGQQGQLLGQQLHLLLEHLHGNVATRDRRRLES